MSIECSVLARELNETAYLGHLGFYERIILEYIFERRM
jgi:hypothetical protein